MLSRNLYRRIIYLLLITGLLLAHDSSIMAQTIITDDFIALNDYLNSQVKGYNIPGIAVAIVKDDKIIFIKGYGESGQGKPVTAQTGFYIGSLTKSFTALAVLQLAEQGKLRLDDPVQKYLPWFSVNDPQASSVITVRNLLNHTSGLSETGDPDTSIYTSSHEEQARFLKDVRLTAPVGSRFQYYNPNYRVLGLLIETVTGLSYNDYMQRAILKPIGMKNTTGNPADASHLSQGYSRFFGFQLPRQQVFIPGGLASGYLISTAEDMAYYMIAQLNNLQHLNKQLLKPESVKLMRTPPGGIGSNYAMGWMVLNNGNTMIHGGTLHNFESLVKLDMKEKTGVVILINQNSIENMIFENSAIQQGIFDILKRKTAERPSLQWIGWLLLALASVDLLNHIRLFRRITRWKEKVHEKSLLLLYIKTGIGILFPAAIIFGVPPFINAVMGGAPTWIEPFRLMPDICTWLLVSMGLYLIRNLIYAVIILKR